MRSVPGCCCWPTVTSPARSYGGWPPGPAPTWPGGSRRTWCSRRCRCCRTGRSCQSCQRRPRTFASARPAPSAASRPARPRATSSGSSSTRSPSRAADGAHPDRAVSAGHHTAGSPAGASRRARHPLPPAVGNRERLRRAEDPAPRRRVHPALQITRTRLPGAVRVPHRLPGAMRPGSRSRTAGRHRPRPYLLHRDRPHRPRPRRQPRHHHPAQPGPGTAPGHRRPHQRPSAPPPRPPLRTRQETAEKQLPGNETRTGKATQPGHLHNQNQPESILTCTNALTHRHYFGLGGWGLSKVPSAPSRRHNAKETGLRNLPLHGFGQNQTWCELVAMASELTAWMAMLALDGPARAWEPQTPAAAPVLFLCRRAPRPRRPPATAAHRRQLPLGHPAHRGDHPAASPRPC